MQRYGFADGLPTGWQLLQDPRFTDRITFPGQVTLGRCLQAIVKAGDKATDGTSRAEIRAKPINFLNGSEWWYSFLLLVPEAHVARPGWLCAHQVKEASPGNPTWALYLLNDQMRLECGDGQTGAPRQKLDVGPIRRGKVERWTFHVKVTTSDKGLVELYRDGVQVASVTRRTRATTTAEMCPRWGIYRAPVNVTDTLYIGDIRLGATRAEIEPPPDCTAEEAAVKAALAAVDEADRQRAAALATLDAAKAALTACQAG